MTFSPKKTLNFTEQIRKATASVGSRKIEGLYMEDEGKNMEYKDRIA